MNYGKWTVPLLQDELRRRGVRCSGRKADLVERLQGLDAIRTRERPPALPPPAPPIAWPDAAAFRSVTGALKDKLPDITKESLEQYVLYR